MINKKSKYLVTFPAFSFDKIALYYKIRKEKGISAFECSFLLGKHNFFIRDTENPFKPTLIDPEDSAQIGKILLLEDYNPPVTPLDLYKLNVEELKIDRKRIKRIITIESDQDLPNKYLEICTEEKEDEVQRLVPECFRYPSQLLPNKISQTYTCKSHKLFFYNKISLS